VKTLCVGEALVDLVCERPAASIAEADAFVPHPGGAVANVAMVAARAGADVALAGGAGDDAWGAWLRDRLAAEGVDLRWFHLVEGEGTTIAFVTVSEHAEPSFLLHGDGLASAIGAVGPQLRDAVGACDALFLASNTLATARDSALTADARERALALGRPVVFDPNLRLHRWPDAEAAARAALACVPGAFLVRCNEAEAEMLTGEHGSQAAATALLGAGAAHVVVSRGARGALLRGGGVTLDVPGVPARAVDATGAGDTLMGTLLAALGREGCTTQALAGALPAAVAAAARATEHFGAVA
jgi:fructokinase